MTLKNVRNDERMLQFLADRATQGLDSLDAAEVNDRFAADVFSEALAFEKAAAAIDLSLFPTNVEPLPAGLRDRLLTDAGAYLATTERWALKSPTGHSSMDIFDRSAGRRTMACMGWYLAAAALALAFVGGWRFFSVVDTEVRPPQQRYVEFLREAKDAIRANWVGKETGFEGVSGEIVWSGLKQHGLMKLVGVPPNDPAIAQYQLWIVDPGRDSYPIDGGVFDVRSADESIVSIDAKLRTESPALFAITLEKPGGVVVSGGPLLVVASIDG